jgi:hypothetical protein
MTTLSLLCYPNRKRLYLRRTPTASRSRWEPSSRHHAAVVVQTSTSWVILRMVLACCLLGSGGCGYFWGTDDSKQKREQEKAEQEAAKVPPFEPGKMAVLPAGIPTESLPAADPPSAGDPSLWDENDELLDASTSSLDSGGLSHVLVKPGHHVVTRHELLSNAEDVVAILENACVDRNSVPMALPNLSMALGVEQQVSLPHGQTRLFDVPIFMPIAQDGRKFFQVLSRLKERMTGRTLTMDGHAVSSLRADQYHILILTKSPEKFSFLRMLPCVTPPRPLDRSTELPWDFVVQRPDLNERVTLPNNALMLTSTAYVIWDGLEPNSLNSLQATAILDWLHWGGQIIVNGVRSLDGLRGSFLDPYLPAVDYQPRELSPPLLDRINRQWSKLSDNARLNTEKYALRFGFQSESQILELSLRDGSEIVPGTDGLLAERRVGRGRVVVSGFDLGGAPFVRWPGYDGFVNACIFRRPARGFAAGVENEIAVYYRGTTSAYGGAHINTQLRIFSRDATDGRTLDVDARADPEKVSSSAEGFSVDPLGGIAAWSDFSLPPQLVRESLHGASGITIPKAGSIASMITVYLVCLVPLNWLVFRSLGRVEWAWFAAPIIAILGAVSVARLAQLDVGFVRSQTDLAILELQPAYSRAHASRFTSLYSSLTTNYRCKWTKNDLVVVPMADDIKRSLRRMEEIQLVRQRLDSPMEATGFRVLSNSSGLLRAEEYVDLGGDLTLLSLSDTHIQIRNRTKLQLQGVCVMFRDTTGFRMGYTAQAVEPNEDVSIPLMIKSARWKQELPYAVVRRQHSQEVNGNIDLTALRDLAVDPRRADIGECRLAAWSDALVSTLEISPVASQRKAATLIIANLAYSKWSPPTPDLSCTAAVFETILRGTEVDTMEEDGAEGEVTDEAREKGATGDGGLGEDRDENPPLETNP